MRTWRTVLGGLLACAVAALVCPAAAGASETLVRPGSLSVLSDVFETLPVIPAPADGRLRGYGFSARVTGDRCASSISGPGVRLVSGPGDEICAFGFTVSFSSSVSVTDDGEAVPGFSAHVVDGTETIPLTTTEVGESPDEEFALGVVPGHTAELVMSAAGYSQSFSLTAGARPGTSPEVLYRAPGSSEVTASPGTVLRLSERSGHATASMRVELTSLSLGWFMEGDPLVRPPAPDDAFLALGFNETDETGPSGVRFTDFAALPGTCLSLELPGGTNLHGVLVETVATGMFANAYVFSVPAAITDATLVVSPGTRDGDEDVATGKARGTRAGSPAARRDTDTSGLVPVRSSSARVPLSVPDPLRATKTSTPTTTSPAVTSTTTVHVDHRGRAGTTKTTVAKVDEHAGERHERDHHERQQHHRRSGRRVEVAQRGPHPTEAAGPVAPTTAAVSLPVVATAAGAAGGTSIIVIPLVVVWRRRQKGARLRLWFPKAAAAPPPEPPDLSPEHTDRGAPLAETAPVSPPETSERAILGVAEPPAGPAGARRIHLLVLGPVVVEGLGDVPRRSLLEELCAYGVLSGGREISSEKLRVDLGRSENDWSPATLYKRVSELRSALGRDVLVRSSKGTYRFCGEVTSDWASFEELTSTTAPNDEGRIEQLRAALLLVRGVPFEGAVSPQYRWALNGRLAHEMTVAIENAALELAAILTEKARGHEAMEACRMGLRGVPYSQGLRFAHLRAGATGGRGSLEQAWREVVAMDGGEEPELRGLYDRLRAERSG